MIKVIRVDPPTAEARQLWGRALELAADFGIEEPWTLVGGLMVQLHAFEHGSASRLTGDVDFLGDARGRPEMTARMAEVLAKRNAEMTIPSRGSENTGYQFEVDGSIVEILGPDGLRADPRTLGSYRTIQVPGGTQALRRTEIVLVSLAGAEPAAMKRPSLPGAILIKARAVEKRRRGKFQSDRQDLIRLLGFVDDPRALGDNLKGSEKRWLRDVDSLLDFGDDALGEALRPWRAGGRSCRLSPDPGIAPRR